MSLGRVVRVERGFASPSPGNLLGGILDDSFSGPKRKSPFIYKDPWPEISWWSSWPIVYGVTGELVRDSPIWTNADDSEEEICGSMSITRASKSVLADPVREEFNMTTAYPAEPRSPARSPRNPMRVIHQGTQRGPLLLTPCNLHTVVRNRQG
ncbi:uncharacterized protein BDW43DRAFT_314800 [Aspergillus alliaceus]|uniref:uncharacterized protein n=1 Tax=Petromyces alliaceus TaxID=209559 RepID=UPI0012A66457|nr:uncharacterized protein BDW43DRAFT_314800 [Aspergillus alliaceus]KAB8229600.1 hypothetical protein BDW43DRAFT_314800 [Aspergillus alliaceus]